MIGIPVVTLVLLSLIGMPFGGAPGDNPEQAEKWRQVKLYRPPMTTEEAQLILAKVQFWVDDRAQDYIRRSRLTEDSHEKNFWQEVAKGVLSPAENELSAIIDAAAKQKKIPEAIRDATLQWISKVDKLRHRTGSGRPFPADSLKAHPTHMAPWKRFQVDPEKWRDALSDPPRSTPRIAAARSAISSYSSSGTVGAADGALEPRSRGHHGFFHRG